MITLDDLLAQVDAFQEPEARRSLAVGLAIRFIEKKWGAQHVAAHIPHVIAAVNANQFAFFFDDRARAVAFTTWATVDTLTMDRMIESGPSALADEDWESGDHLWIIDFYASPGRLPQILEHLRDKVLVHYSTVAYFRYRSGYRIARQLTRTDLSGFCGARAAFAGEAEATRITNFDTLLSRRESFMQRLQVGQIMRALVEAEQATPMLLRSSRLVQAIATMRQYQVFQLSDGSPSGLLTWAWLSDYTIARVEKVPLHEVHLSEWNEGKTLCFLDVAVSRTCLAEVVEAIAGRLFPDERKVLLYMGSSQVAPAEFISLNRQFFGDEIDKWVALTTGVPRQLSNSR